MDTSIPDSPADPYPAVGPNWLLWPQRSAELARQKVIVLGGGTSDEREVSLRSAESMAAALGGLSEHQRTALPASLQTVEIDATGHWVVAGRALDRNTALEQLHPDGLFFLALHGGEGEDGRIQRMLAERGLSFTGSGAESSALCMDKARAIACAREAGLQCAPGLRVDHDSWQRDPARVRNQALGLGLGPWFVKPNCGGSSVGVVRATDPVQLSGAIESVLATGQVALVEQEIGGLEVSVGVLGGSGTPTRGLPVCEILPSAGHFFDYHEKYDGSGATENCPPLQTPPERALEVQGLACTAFDALGCEGYGRVDFILPRGDGPPVFLEVNTLPGMTERSLLPLAAEAAGMDMGSLCLEILARALPRSSPEVAP